MVHLLGMLQSIGILKKWDKFNAISVDLHSFSMLLMKRKTLQQKVADGENRELMITHFGLHFHMFLLQSMTFGGTFV